MWLQLLTEKFAIWRLFNKTCQQKKQCLLFSSRCCAVKRPANKTNAIVYQLSTRDSAVVQTWALAGRVSPNVSRSWSNATWGPAVSPVDTRDPSAPHHTCISSSPPSPETDPRAVCSSSGPCCSPHVPHCSCDAPSYRSYWKTNATAKDATTTTTKQMQHSPVVAVAVLGQIVWRQKHFKASPIQKHKQTSGRSLFLPFLTSICLHMSKKKKQNTPPPTTRFNVAHCRQNTLKTLLVSFPPARWHKPKNSNSIWLLCALARSGGGSGEILTALWFSRYATKCGRFSPLSAPNQRLGRFSRALKPTRRPKLRIWSIHSRFWGCVCT